MKCKLLVKLDKEKDRQVPQLSGAKVLYLECIKLAKSINACTVSLPDRKNTFFISRSV